MDSNENDIPVLTEFLISSGELLDQAMLKLRHCLDQLNDEQINASSPEYPNSISNLILHICGNLRQWGIVPITGEADHRDRLAEFDESQIGSKKQLIAMLASSTVEAQELWTSLKDEQLVRRCRIQGFQVTLLKAIMHTATHFVGHTHQVILLTRLQLGDNYRFHWSPDSPRDQLPI